MSSRPNQNKPAINVAYEVMGKFIVVWTLTAISLSLWFLVAKYEPTPFSLFIEGVVINWVWRGFGNILPSTNFNIRPKFHKNQIPFYTFIVFFATVGVWIVSSWIYSFINYYEWPMILFKGVLCGNFIYSIIHFLVCVKIDSKKESLVQN